MQDRYAGDIGDFGKYGLLRALCGEDEHGPALRLGVLWYRVPNEKGNNDGRHTGYVHSGRGTSFEECDPELFAIMRTIVCGGTRSITRIEKSGALPRDTLYFSRPLKFHGMKPGNPRALKRRTWLAAAEHAVKGAEIVFADPDNGLETSSVGQLTAKGPKYVYNDDLDTFVDGRRSIVVYHHLGRQKHEQQIKRRLGELRERLDTPQGAFALRYRRGTARAYFVLPAPKNAELLRTRAEALLGSFWGKNEHFDQVVYE